MTRYIVYPALLDDTDNPKGFYTVTFPDIPEAISQGDGIAEAMVQGSHALGLAMYKARVFPKATDVEEVRKNNKDKKVVLIASDLVEARKHVTLPKVKKNTTIPEDLAKKADKAGVNFSQVL